MRVFVKRCPVACLLCQSPVGQPRDPIAGVPVVDAVGVAPVGEVWLVVRVDQRWDTRCPGRSGWCRPRGWWCCSRCVEHWPSRVPSPRCLVSHYPARVMPRHAVPTLVPVRPGGGVDELTAPLLPVCPPSIAKWTAVPAGAPSLRFQRVALPCAHRGVHPPWWRVQRTVSLPHCLCSPVGQPRPQPRLEKGPWRPVPSPEPAGSAHSSPR